MQVLLLNCFISNEEMVELEAFSIEVFIVTQNGTLTR